MDSLKTLPDLSACCIREKLDLPLRLWYLLRQLCPDGRGWWPLREVFELSSGSKRQTLRWLREGEGLFWFQVHDRDGQKLRLRSLDNVCDSLGIVAIKAPVFVPLKGGLRTWRANLFASFFAGEKFIQISQARLSEIFGRSPRCLYTWSRLADLEIKHNLSWVEYDHDDLDRYPVGVLQALGIKDAEEETGPTGNCWLEHWERLPNEAGKKWTHRRGNKTVLCWTLPNGYRSGFPVGRVTTLQKRARKKVRETLTLGRGSFSELSFTRLFYDDVSKAARAMQAGVEPLYLKEEVEHWSGQLWHFHTREKPKPTTRKVPTGGLAWVRKISPLTGCVYYDSVPA